MLDRNTAGSTHMLRDEQLTWRNRDLQAREKQPQASPTARKCRCSKLQPCQRYQWVKKICCKEACNIC